MLQTRVGRCPNCKEETLPGAEICPNCGTRLGWESTARTAEAARRSTPRPVAKASVAHAPTPYLRWFVLFLAGCAIVAAALSFLSSSSGDDDEPGLKTNHATLVQDAELFRDGLRSAAGSPASPEASLVIGVALPNETELLEITVRNEWKRYDYATRLNYAKRFVERWKAIIAPHRANLTILDEAGNEIGGRTWNGTVWVQEGQDTKRASKPKAAPARNRSTPTAGTTRVAPGSTPAPPSADALSDIPDR
jgi:hypothetical protein